MVLSQFNPADVGSIVGIGFDAQSDSVWIYGSSGASLRSYDRSGVFQSAIDRPGESADDFDISFTTQSLSLGSSTIPAGSLLAINGESGTADVYAVDPSTGAIVSSLATGFGNSHVVGGAYHNSRGSLFLVQDRQASSAALRSLIAEVDPISGAVLNTFGTGSATFTINFGDLEINRATGNLYLVSSDEDTIRVLTPTGGFVEEITLPGTLGALSGIAFDEARGEAWVSSTNGIVYRLGGLPQLDVSPVPEPGSLVLASVGLGGAAALMQRRRREKRG